MPRYGPDASVFFSERAKGGVNARGEAFRVTSFRRPHFRWVGLLVVVVLIPRRGVVMLVLMLMLVLVLALVDLIVGGGGRFVHKVQVLLLHCTPTHQLSLLLRQSKVSGSVLVCDVWRFGLKER